MRGSSPRNTARLKVLRCLITSVWVAAGASAATAQPWPTRAIQVISPFSAGSANEIVARIVLDEVSRRIGQSIIIENRPGGGGTIGAAIVANAAADGYTLLLHSASLSSGVVLHKTLPYDPVRDFAPIIPFGVSPSVLVIAPSKNYASAGIGSASHMAAERLRVASGIEAQHIPFRGPVEAFTEVMAGRIDFYFLPIAPALPVISDGKVRALAVSTPKRAAALPNVPTVAEAGYPSAEYLFWGGLSAPARTPRDIIDKLHRESEKAMKLAAITERFSQLGVELMPMSVEQFQEFFRDDVAATVKLARDARIVPTE
jgi:tripartite-type tricarboxylate transporter receptor subunit TctC